MTRGQVNNNPGNIDRTTIKWQGMAAVQSDPRFITFTDPKYGFRAMARIIHGHFGAEDTVQGIINRWAPPEENATDSYVADVCQHMGVGATDVLQWDRDALALLRAIAIHENGSGPGGTCLWADMVIMQGIQLEQST